MPPSISYIIPTLNEEAALERTLQSVISQEGEKEIVIADGGSVDQTLAIAQRFDCSVTRTEPGRGRQMNAAAERADGGILFFLHADTSLPPNAQVEISRLLDTPGVVGGAFGLTFDPCTPALRFYARCARLNSAWFAYGDQGLFLHKATFEAIGKFRPYPILEDVEIQSRLRKEGRFVKSKLCVTTSSRRFLKRGPLKLARAYSQIR